MSEWIDHDGKGIPVHPKTKVNVKFRDGFEGKIGNPWEAGLWGINWDHDEVPCGADIVAYQITEPHAPSSPSGP